jgi:hypothetical protein
MGTDMPLSHRERHQRTRAPIHVLPYLLPHASHLQQPREKSPPVQEGRAAWRRSFPPAVSSAQCLPDYFCALGQPMQNLP